ncbi:hypothetical protein ES706_03332 [subsurface metagenome]|nr:hypothetical protein [Bacillota bacterium]
MLKELSLSETVFRRLLYTLLILAIGLYVLHALYYGSWIYDDAGISFTYARNFANGFGLVLNPGGERVEGYSNPLWVFVLSVFFKLGLFDPVVTPKVLGIIFTIVSFYLIYRISQQIFADKRSILHGIAPLLLATNTSFVVWSISGLENAFYVFLIILGIYLYLAELEDTRRFPFSSLVLFLVSITRPEGVIYFAAAFIHKILVLIIRKKGGQFLLWTGLFVIPFFMYHVWHYQYFADFFSNTSYTKKAVGNIIFRLQKYILDFNSRGWRLVKMAFEQYNLTFIFIFCSLATTLYFRRFFAKISFLFLFIGMSIFFPLYVRGVGMKEFRILSPFFPLAYIVISGGLFALWQFQDTRIPKKGALHTLSYHVLVLIIITLSAFLVYSNMAFAGKAKQRLMVPFSKLVNRGEKFKGLAKEAFIENASLLEADIGGTSYTAGLKIIDLSGLADVHIGKYHYEKEYFGDYIFKEKKPTFIYTHGIWSHRSQIHKYPEFKRDYLPLWEQEWEQPAHKYKTLKGGYVRKDVFIVNTLQIKNKLHKKLNRQIELIGYTSNDDIAAPGGKYHIILFWKALESGSSKEEKYKYAITFNNKGNCNGKREGAIYLDDIQIERGQTVSKRKSYPYSILSFVYGWYPCNKWRKGETIKEERDITIPENTQTGNYSLVLVLLEGGYEINQITLGDILISEQEAFKKAQDYFQLYQTALEHRNFEKALEFIRKALTLKPKDKVFQEAVEVAKVKAVQTYVGKARILLERRKYRAAIEILQKAKSIDKFNARVLRLLSKISSYYYEKGEIYRKKKMWRESFEFYQKALDLSPSNVWARKKMEALRPRLPKRNI